MPHVDRKYYDGPSAMRAEREIRKTMMQLKWRTVAVHIAEKVLTENFDFLNDAVVIRSGKEGVPFLTTTAIFGPIKPGNKVRLSAKAETGVEVLEEICRESLIDELDLLFKTTKYPGEAVCATVNACWLSAKNGGAIPGLSSSSNVFGSTGSLFVNQEQAELPVLDYVDSRYEEVLAYYGGKLLKPGESFALGFDHLLFGMQYDTRLPDYVDKYAMQPSGGGGLFVEHHPFPHIFWPQQDANGQVNCEAKIILGRESESSTRQNPKFTFTIFRIPSDGSAIVIRPNTIHNDSFTQGKLTVFLANTPADTVAWRKTAPYKDIHLTDVDPAIYPVE